MHLSEQRAENEACLAAYGRTPTRCWPAPAPSGREPRPCTPPTSPPATSPCSALPGATVCLCPTTERDLADGIGPAPALADAGSALSLGRDSHAVVDLLEEARGVELDERLAAERRGHFAARGAAAGGDGAGSLGWPEAGRWPSARSPTW